MQSQLAVRDKATVAYARLSPRRSEGCSVFLRRCALEGHRGRDQAPSGQIHAVHQRCDYIFNIGLAGLTVPIKTGAERRVWLAASISCLFISFKNRPLIRAHASVLPIPSDD